MSHPIDQATLHDESAAILVEVEAAVGTVTLNRPWAMNSFTTDSARRFIEAMRRLVDDPAVRVVVLTGAGDRAFCTGADLKERHGMTTEQWQAQHEVFEEKNRVVRDCPKPTIASLNGYAVGGGAEIALSTDFIYASTTSQLGLAEVRRGIMPGGGGTQLLARRAPLGAALEMLMTGALIDATEAHRLGIVNRVCEPDRLAQDVTATAQTLAMNSPTALWHVKQAVRDGAHLALEQALQVELHHYAQLIDHPDRVEGIAAFVEHRQARFEDLVTAPISHQP